MNRHPERVTIGQETVTLNTRKGEPAVIVQLAAAGECVALRQSLRVTGERYAAFRVRRARLEYLFTRCR